MADTMTTARPSASALGRAAWILALEWVPLVSSEKRTQGRGEIRGLARARTDL